MKSKNDEGYDVNMQSLSDLYNFQVRDQPSAFDIDEFLNFPDFQVRDYPSLDCQSVSDEQLWDQWF